MQLVKEKDNTIA